MSATPVGLLFAFVVVAGSTPMPMAPKARENHASRPAGYWWRGRAVSGVAFPLGASQPTHPMFFFILPVPVGKPEPVPWQAIATLVVGFAVVIIAWRQWRVAHNKLRLDLFEKRYTVYEGAKTFLSVIFSHGDFTGEDLRAFNLATRDALFLFPKQIEEYLHTIRSRALHMKMFAKQFELLDVGTARSALVQKHHDELTWLSDQVAAAAKVFAPFLSFASAK